MVNGRAIKDKLVLSIAEKKAYWKQMNSEFTL